MSWFTSRFRSLGRAQIAHAHRRRITAFVFVCACDDRSTDRTHTLRLPLWLGGKRAISPRPKQVDCTFISSGSLCLTSFPIIVSSVQQWLWGSLLSFRLCWQFLYLLRTGPWVKLSKNARKYTQVSAMNITNFTFLHHLQFTIRAAALPLLQNHIQHLQRFLFAGWFRRKHPAGGVFETGYALHSRWQRSAYSISANAPPQWEERQRLRNRWVKL